MANEVCKYNNDFNTVSMRNWTTEEMNFLMVVLAKLKNQGNKTIRIQKNELVELANYPERNKTSSGILEETLIFLFFAIFFGCIIYFMPTRP